LNDPLVPPALEEPKPADSAGRAATAVAPGTTKRGPFERPLASNLGAWDVEFPAGKATWSEGCFRVLGYPPNPTGEGSFEMWTSRIHPDDLESVLAAYECARVEHGAYHAEYRILHPETGEISWLADFARFLYDADGRAVAATGLFVNITAPRCAEDRLLDSERQMRSLADNSPDILARFDRELRYVFMNAASTEATGHPPEHFLGRTNREIGMPADLCDLWEEAARQVFATGTPLSIEFTFESQHGQRYYKSRQVPEFGPTGKVEHVLVVTTDSTDWKSAEYALQQSEQRYRTLVESIPVLAWSSDAKAGKLHRNHRWFELTGQTTEEAEDEGWKAIIHPEDLDRMVARWGQAFEDGQEFEADFRIRRAADGTYRWHSARAIPSHDERGELTGWYGAAVDIEDKRRAEEELREAHVRKDEFLATLAHELRNPLAPVLHALDLMRLEGPDGAMFAQAQAMMERQLGQMVHLIDDLLDVSRITQGKLELRRERLELTAVIESAVETSRPLIERKRQRLAILLPPEPIFLDADLTRLSQVVLNLLNNAAKYTPDEGRIELTTGLVQGRAVITVKDTGSGIPPDMLPRIFDMFTQAERGHGRAHGGLGIGLTLVRRLTEMHGGTVEAQSDGPGRGSVFVVCLPLAAA
jgi:PAS domain S-box-containing protein